MKTNGKKLSKLVYITILIVGSCFIILGASFYSRLTKPWPEILIGIGCSTIPTVILTYLIERINLKDLVAKKEMYKNSVVCQVPYAIAKTAQLIINTFMPIEKDQSQNSFQDLLRLSINNMKSINPGEDEITKHANIRDAFLKRLKFPFSIICETYKRIDTNKDFFLINNIFSEEEIIFYYNLREEFDYSLNLSLISEIGEGLEEFFNYVVQYSPKVKKLLETKPTLKNGIIQHWDAIVKSCNLL